MTRVNTKPTTPRPKAPKPCPVRSIRSEIDELRKLHTMEPTDIHQHEARIADLIYLVSRLNDKVEQLENRR